MKIKEWQELFKENYWKDKQCLLLETYVDAKRAKRRNQYYSQEIIYKDVCLCGIDTLDYYRYSTSLGSIPYCRMSKWGTWEITVPKFGQLIDKDVYKAIGYVLKQIGGWRMWLIYLDGKHILIDRFHDYEIDSELLREFKEEERNNEN